MSGTLTDVAVYLEQHSGSSQPINIEITRLNAGVPDLTQVVASGRSFRGILTPEVLPPSTSPRRLPRASNAIVAQSAGEWGWRPGSSTTTRANLYQRTTSGPSSRGATTGTSKRSSPRHRRRAPARRLVADNTTDGGATIAPGTFVNLDDGQIYTDPHYAGATPAIFVQGEGLTCGAPPVGYTQQGDATSAMDPAGIEPATSCMPCKRSPS